MESQIAPELDFIYKQSELTAVNFDDIPHHVAIIMDGNRRWAERQGYAASMGHLRGADRVDPIVRAAAFLGVRVLTVYAFSTENWKRSDGEVGSLMDLFERYLRAKKSQLIAEGVRLKAIGNLEKLPQKVQNQLLETISATEDGEKIDLVLAVNYGGRDEICRGIKKMVKAAMHQQLHPEEITEAKIARFLDTALWPDPELVIRTSGEQRMSNFLTWQATYSEILVTDVLWPDFSERDFLDLLLKYQRRHRRFGG